MKRNCLVVCLFPERCVLRLKEFLAERLVEVRNLEHAPAFGKTSSLS
jgi:hypothetical protein